MKSIFKINKRTIIILITVVFLLVFFIILTKAYYDVLSSAKNFELSNPVQSTTNGTYDTVIIDAGHGGEDGGAVGVDKTVEKDLNLAVSLKLAETFKKVGYKVILTRNGDYSIYSDGAKTIREKKVSDIHNRFKIIKDTDNCIFVSIHMNHYDNPSCNGAQVFYSKNNPESKILAEDIQDSIKKLIQPSNERKIKKGTSSIYLLYYTDVPAVLVECGFISNPEECNKLKQKEYQEQMAYAVYDGVIKYLKSPSEVKTTSK